MRQHFLTRLTVFFYLINFIILLLNRHYKNINGFIYKLNEIPKITIHSRRFTEHLRMITHKKIFQSV